MAAVVVGLAAGRARADGELSARGMYYKERATRVVQPMLDASFDVGDRGSGDAHFLVDAITSASAATGSSGSAFTEKRYEGGAGYQRDLGHVIVGGLFRYSTEPDYRSVYGSAHADLELFQKNFTLSATFGGGTDKVTNAGAPPMVPRITGHLRTLLGSLSASQIVSEHGLVGLSYDLVRLDGYQQNPYRVVSAGGTLVAERHPDARTRHAIAASIRWFFPKLDTTVIGQYRFYADDWGLVAHTPEVRVVKDVGDYLTFGLRYRYHTQRAADFYKTMYASSDPAVEPYLSDDAKLSAFDGHLFGARAEVSGGALGLTGRLEAARVELVGEYVIQHNLFGNAVVSYAALVLPFDY
ncbi:MAG TPA: DUF3570 domain-containing protein [Kofleriaceae bacterium]|nr:DUF3570 domain-containing protein [Kofleriaceae bacterium]